MDATEPTTKQEDTGNITVPEIRLIKNILGEDVFVLHSEPESISDTNEIPPNPPLPDFSNYVKSRTIIKSASVKVMLSYNYNHFESSMTLENPMGVTLDEIDEARKNLNRLNNKAIKQYKEAKEAADQREQSAYLRAEFKAQCERILKKPEEERTAEQKAQLKQYQDEDWENQFDFDYDFEDDDEDWAPWGTTIETSK